MILLSWGGDEEKGRRGLPKDWPRNPELEYIGHVLLSTLQERF